MARLPTSSGEIWQKLRLLGDPTCQDYFYYTAETFGKEIKSTKFVHIIQNSAFSLTKYGRIFIFIFTVRSTQQKNVMLIQPYFVKLSKNIV